MPCLKLQLDGPDDTDAEQRLVRAIEAEPGVLGVVFCHDRRGLEIDFEDDEVTIDHLIGIARAQRFEARLIG